MIWAFCLITIFISLPCSYIVVTRIILKEGISGLAKDYISKLSIGNVFKSKLEKAAEYSFNLNNTEAMADALMYLNMFAVGFLLFWTIIMRNSLVKMALSLDHD